MTATADDLLNEIHLLRGDVAELVTVLRAQAEANEPQLYCPPSEHCPGGYPLSKHAPKYWKNDGEDNDRLFHPLPEEHWYKFTGEGAFNGSTVRNHNVWRSQARREPHAEIEDAYESRPEAAPVTVAEPKPARAEWADELKDAMDSAEVTFADLERYLGARPTNAVIQEWLQRNAPASVRDLVGKAIPATAAALPF